MCLGKLGGQHTSNDLLIVNLRYRNLGRGWVEGAHRDAAFA